MSGLKIGTLP